MMRCLHEGGVPVVAENYTSYEDSRATTHLPHDGAWLAEARGKAIKILEPHHFYPPRNFEYDFILMRRNPAEQARSQLKFLHLVSGLPKAMCGENQVHRMTLGIMKDYPKVETFLNMYFGSRVLPVKFEDLLARPDQQVRYLEKFLGRQLYGTPEHPMVSCVVPRSPKCWPGLMELKLHYANKS
jgi:hypothetical protein